MAKRCVVVTGGDSGIGAACSVAFGEAGDDVAILYHSDEEGAGAVADRVRAAGGRAIVQQCDVGEEMSVERAFLAAEDAFGTAQVLVNSAGVNMAGVNVRDMEVDHWNRMIATDLTGAFLTSRRFLRARGDGEEPASIIHISSIHARTVRAGGADYSAAKGGLTRLVQSLTLEEACRGVRINAIEPGMILTPMNQEAMDDPEVRKRMEGNIPAKRAGKPEEVAALARFLASDEAAYINGAAIPIDGGLSLLLAQGA